MVLAWGRLIFNRSVSSSVALGRLKPLEILTVALSLSIIAGCDIGDLILTADPWDPPPKPAIAKEPLPRDACAHVVK